MESQSLDRAGDAKDKRYEKVRHVQMGEAYELEGLPQRISYRPDKGYQNHQNF
jgi:hypothetical protein